MMAQFKEIKNSQEWGEILDESSRRKIILFKHSTTCPISACAWREVQDFLLESQDEVLVVMIKVIESRAVSNQVTEELGVMHQSPQALLISERKVVWHVSHQAVTLEKITKALES